MKKNIYFVQPSNSLSKSFFLPYASGSIAAYSFQHEEIKQNFNLADIIFEKEPIDKAVEKINCPYIVGFSCYMWNIEYNLTLAMEVKAKYPDVITVFGGPQVPDDTEYLEKYSFIDLLIHGEGEIAFHELLKNCLTQKSFENINNISYRENGEYKKTPSIPVCDLTQMPSPYAAGVFDKIIHNPKYAGFQFDTVIETNRGCPYKCIYCCWSEGKGSLRFFPDERIKNDLDWIAKNKIPFCVCADSNFGIVSRDEKIADYVVELNKKYGYPQKFETTSAKNKDDFVFRINRKLDSRNLNRGISVAVQSMSEDVLEIIGRKNIGVGNLSQTLKAYRDAGMYTYTDIILGLPGETLESFCRGLFDVIEAGQHYSVAVYRCELLPNTILYSDEMQKKYKIKTITSQFCQKHSIANENADSSRSCIVVETSTMSSAEWLTAERITTAAISFHNMGLLRFFAVYLRKALNVSYYDFYMKLYEWIENESSVIKRLLDYACQSFIPFLEGKGNLCFSDERFGNIYWDFDEALFLCSAAELDAFYDDVKDYLKRYFDDTEIFEDLLKYQKEMIARPCKGETVFETQYDWHEYFRLIFDAEAAHPEKKKTVLKIAESETDNWFDYARIVAWYGRRSGKSINRAEYI